MTTKTGSGLMVAAIGRGFAEKRDLPEPCSVISLRNPDCEPVEFRSASRIRRRLDLAFHDLDTPAPPLVMPTQEQARACLDFVRGHPGGLLVCQCDAGAGRSQATQAAILRMHGRADLADGVLARGTYTRPWHRLLLEAAGLEVPREPMVSVVVRLKYPPDRARAVLYSLDRQRWDNWEAILVGDGPEDPEVIYFARREVRHIETPERKGRWGHPHRQMGINAARGEWVCLTNDDNYHVPGFIEQMVGAGVRERADLVLCDMLHRYQGWNVCRSSLEGPEISTDVAAWMARAELVKSTPWPGNDFDSDGKYVAALAEKANKVAHVRRPLVVKN